MGDQADRYIMIVLILGILFALYRGCMFWLRKPMSLRTHMSFELNEIIEDHPAVDLLIEAGYTVISGKLRVPLTFRMNHTRLNSRLFIDYVVTQGDEIYLVKTSRPRLHVEWTGIWLRKEWLPYLLLYPDCAGLIYIDAEHSEIKVITLDSDEIEE
ncbi:hypothetical protein J2Z69_000468 [Paenibacillus shirakamiensis]|uniref:Uncharacterized protein n=1 Tax=Paenibacillus shirakamiensis TaxID=1265935 RepID=A0ABS4JCJ1_9BACL|nr:hypothetical protein [Paenibacillus shirakamiensis]MBP1999449.1 hypothetical protein [Paenibacillus shirakamiensis]